MTSWLDRVERGLALGETLFLWIANLCLAAMLGANMLNIAVRGIFDRGIIWVFPWTSVLFIWLSFFGFYVVYRRGRDITVDYLFERLGGAGKIRLTILANLVVLAVLGTILVQAPKVLAAQVGDIELTGLARWMQSVPLFLSALLIVIDVICRSARALRAKD